MNDDSVSATLDDASEAEWTLLREQLDLADGFWIGFFFSDGRRTPRVIAARVEGTLHERGASLRRIAPTTPDALRACLADVVKAAREGTGDMLWIEAIEAPGDADGDASWSAAWRDLLMRANEHREVFVRHHRGPLVFVAPSWVKPLAQERAPDLWALRAMVGAWPVPALPRPLDDFMPWIRPLREAPVGPVGDGEVLRARAEEVLARSERFAQAFQPVQRAARALIDEGRHHDARTLLLRLRDLPYLREIDGAARAHALALLADEEARRGDRAAAIDHLYEAVSQPGQVDGDAWWGWCAELLRHLVKQRRRDEATQVADAVLAGWNDHALTNVSVFILSNAALFAVAAAALRSADTRDWGAQEERWLRALQLARRVHLQARDEWGHGVLKQALGAAVTYARRLGRDGEAQRYEEELRQLDASPPAATSTAASAPSEEALPTHGPPVSSE